jgi:hypothetical protein
MVKLQRLGLRLGNGTPAWVLAISAARVVASSFDLDWRADREAKLTIRAPLIDRDFDKSIRIFVPEGAAYRQIAESSRVLQDPTYH